MHDFTQVDVFSAEALRGNPVAVVHGADDLMDEQMAAFARWTNLMRAFFNGVEHPVTGSLNAGLAQWLVSRGTLPRTYTGSQGTSLGRRGRVEVEQVGDDIWIGGATRSTITGQVSLSL